MINKYESDLKKIGTDCHKQSGLIYEIFCNKFNSELILYLSDKSESERIEIIEIAKRMGFDEQEIGTLPNGDISTCRHGIDINCCPAGCADYIDDPDSTIDDEGYKESLFIRNEINELRNKIIKGNSISPIQWCSLKLFITKNEKAIYWYSLIFTHDDELSNYSDMIKYLQSELIIPEYPF
ncbi:hypothetical protein [Photobacterium damselae]|uniref:hypothetical protein n=1 Tax=Photobacterium damselae TaxID=38293 RepID=UPI0010FE7B26|nr:hypothetical protein [Photobacterium damselae]KAB1511989.1 hypothetical protein FD717_010415 [Photobacterium damselae subsp. damselae]TLS69581.1 hypothetical protein FD718_11615 [Photobacterium damselae subsp. damselae]TLS74575.1 hypothetical protein FD721_18425 [Photobacterium damselae subsp. damselae]TLS84138.1 hypothetical protein FD720_18290 [Photobacterium damselae subsp. damselae]